MAMQRALLAASFARHSVLRSRRCGLESLRSVQGRRGLAGSTKVPEEAYLFGEAVSHVEFVSRCFKWVGENR